MEKGYININENEINDISGFLSRSESHITSVVYGVINEIQEDIAPSFGLKVAVIEQNELALSRHSVTF